MDLEGIDAISTAAVAALGLPAAVVVGRWQMRGALRAEEPEPDTRKAVRPNRGTAP